MNTHSCRIACLGIATVLTGAFAQHKPALSPVAAPPFVGTFYSLTIFQPPFPFNPFPELPVYAPTAGVYVYDDRSVDYGTLRRLPAEASWALLSAEDDGGGVAMLSGGPPDPGGGGGGGGGGGTNIFCNGPTNFSVAQTYSSSNLWLEITLATNNVANLVIHTPDTNAFYDLFGTTNLNSLALPQLSRTNWVWLLRTTGAPANFLWANLTPCEAWFQLGTMLDGDSDGLTTAYENLVSHTLPGDTDTDDDGLSDGWEVFNGLNPLIDDSGQPGSRANYTYDAAGWLRQVFGARSEGIGLDPEGNVTQMSQ